MKKTIILFLILIFLFFGMKNPTSIEIPKEAIRFRILANSNSKYDQRIKNSLKNSIQNDLYDLLKDTKGIENARKTLVSSLPTLDQKISNTLENLNYKEGYTLDYGYHYFPEKEFQGITYEEGEYESLLITLGSGNGDNWWCVLFPPFCLIEAEESEEVEYKFFIQELIEKYL